MNYETPVYEDQKNQVSQWLQAHSDIVHEIEHLRIAIQKTNLDTPVTIELDGNRVTKPIAAWIHRRRDLANLEEKAYRQLTDRGLKEGKVKQSTDQLFDVKIVRCYEPLERDNKIALYSSEPSIIDAKLEIVNATTDIVE